MQGGAVIACSLLESVFRRQMNAVCQPIVESAIRLIVEDCCAGVVQNLLSRLDHLEHCPCVRSPFGNAFNLLCVEDGIDTMNEAIAVSLVRLASRLVSIAVSGANCIRSRVRGGLRLPEFNLCSLLSFANLPPEDRCLSVR